MRGPFTKPVKSLQILALLALVPTFILGAATPADDFYLVRLQAGKAEAAAGRPYEAIDDLKIASFGFLDQPVLLVEGLSRLALAQAAAGRDEDADATLRRIRGDREDGSTGGLRPTSSRRRGPPSFHSSGRGSVADATKLLTVPPVPVPVPTAAPAAVPTAVPVGRPAAPASRRRRPCRSSGRLASGDGGHPGRVESPW